MKKIFLTLIISALTASGIMAQNNSEPATMDVNSYQGVNSALTDSIHDDFDISHEYEWFQDTSTRKYGYKHNGRVVIPARYDIASPFNNGLAYVSINGKWGFIDKKGTLVIPAIYDSVWYFSEGRAPVKIDGKWGFIDKTGALIIPAKYTSVGFYCEGLASVEINGKWGFIDKTGDLVIPAIYDNAYSFKNGKAKVKLTSRWLTIDPSGAPDPSPSPR